MTPIGTSARLYVPEAVADDGPAGRERLRAEKHRHDGTEVVVFTDVVRAPLGGATVDPQATAHLCHVASVQKLLVDDALSEWGFCWRDGDEDRVLQELPAQAFQSSQATVDGDDVAADQVRYRGLWLLFGRDVAAHPFVMARRSSEGDWPRLRTLPSS